MRFMPLALILQALIALFIGAISPLDAAAQSLRPIPALAAHVIDETGTLSAADRQALEERLSAIEARHGSQVAVLMVPTTAPEEIAAFANRVGNTWKIGRKNVGDGVLVLVAKNDRKMRIEVAKALEGAIPDIAAARIIDTAMKPRFRDNDFAGGLQAAIDQLAARIAGEALPAPTPHAADPRNKSSFDWEDLAVFLFFGVVVSGPIARAVAGPRLGGLLMGGGVGLLAFVVTASALVAGGAGLLALIYTWIFSGRGLTRGGIPGAWHGGGSSGGWSNDSGGGFSSGGGGDFGGGGASGDW